MSSENSNSSNYDTNIPIQKMDGDSDLSTAIF